MEQLSHELRWTAPMRLVPPVGEHQKVSADQLQASAGGGLVNHDLRTPGIEGTRAAAGRCHQGHVHKVHAHRPRVGTGYAPESQGIALRLGDRYVLEALGRFPNNVQQRPLRSGNWLRLRGQRLRVRLLRLDAPGCSARKNGRND